MQELTHQYWINYFTTLLETQVKEHMRSAGWNRILYVKEAVGRDPYERHDELFVRIPKPTTHIYLYTPTETINDYYLYIDGYQVNTLDNLPQYQKDLIASLGATEHFGQYQALMSLYWVINFLYDFNDAIYFFYDSQTDTLTTQITPFYE